MSETPQLILRLMTFFYAIGYLALAVFCLHRLLQILGRSRGDAVDFSHARPDGGASGGSLHRSEDGVAPIRPSEERSVRTRCGVDACVARYHGIRPADDNWSFLAILHLHTTEPVN